MSWIAIVPASQVPADRAVCALVDGEQVAVVRTGDDRWYAVSNWDPIGRAMVMSRGLVGSRGEVDVLISPLHKQAYDLETGVCLDRAGVSLEVHDIRIRDGVVEVGLARAERRPA